MFNSPLSNLLQELNGTYNIFDDNNIHVLILTLRAVGDWL